jgi:hypothetical protein
MAVHPTENKLLLAVGDKWGNLGVCSDLFICLWLFSSAVSNLANIELNVRVAVNNNRGKIWKEVMFA